MWQTIGQPKIINFFQRALKLEILSHAYVLVGPPRVGKMTLALDLAMALNCREESRPCGECASCKKILAGKHSDVQIIGLNTNASSDEAKERTEIGIDQIKDALHSASLPPFEGVKRVYIINETEKLSLEASNRLLKTLEEPPGKVIFILITTSLRSVPATVISRCQRINLIRLKTNDIESYLIDNRQIDPEKAKLLSRLSHGCLGWAIEASKMADLLEDRREKFERMRSLINSDYSERFTVAAQWALQFNKKRETVYETLDSWASWWRDILLAKAGCGSDIISIDFGSAVAEMARSYNFTQIKSAISSITGAAEQLKLNGNSRLVLESLMLNLPRSGMNTRARPLTEVQNA